MPSASMSILTPEKEETVSTTSMTSGYLARAQQISGSGFITPVEVSLWIRVTVSNFPVASCLSIAFWIDVFSPIDLERLGVFSTALRDIEPFVRERAAHAAEHAAIDQVTDRRFHHAPRRRGGKKHRLFCSEQCLKLWMNRAVKILKIFAAMPNHRPRKCGHVFSETSTGPGMKSLSCGITATFNAQCNVQRPAR